MEEKQKIKINFKSKRIRLLFMSAIAVLLVAVVTIGVTVVGKNSQPEIISTSTLEKIINVSDLSTFEAVYNGVAKVMNEEEPEKIDYYVSYNAKVKAGVDFEKVKFENDKENKVLTVTVPEVKINDVNVDITSLDYIFVNSNANNSTVSEQAYKKCIEDVKKESNEENAIYELAKQNANNIVEALLSPFVGQLDEEYKLVIN